MRPRPSHPDAKHRDSRRKRSNTVIAAHRFMTLVLSCIFVAVISPATTRPTPPQTQTKDANTPSQSDGKLTFKLKRMSDGFLKGVDGTWFHETVVSVSDGTELYETVISFRKSADEEREFQRIEHIALKVIQQDQETNKSGRVVGRKLIVQLPPDKSHKSSVMLIWNNEKTLHETVADSLSTLLAIENLAAEPSRRNRPK